MGRAIASNPDRPDLTIDRVPIELSFTEGVWIDVSDVPPRSHISRDRVRRAMAEAAVELAAPGRQPPLLHGCSQTLGRPVPSRNSGRGTDGAARRGEVTLDCSTIMDERRDRKSAFLDRTGI